MGICDSAGKSESKKNAKKQRMKTKMPKLKKADLNDSHEISEPELNPKEAILIRGNKKELQQMVNEYSEDIDAYTFGQNKTLLLEACMKCPNPDIVDMIMKKGADIDKEEYQTGNTAIFLSAVDLKVEFVKKLLKYKPNLQHRNHARQNIFDFLNFQLFEQRQKIGREMTSEERDKYQEIENLINEYVNQ